MSGPYGSSTPSLDVSFGSDYAMTEASRSMKRPSISQTATVESPEPLEDRERSNSSTARPPSGSRPRQRRRNAQSGDSVKHKRTRSGCYTCRLRRVKCDETRPICDRCRKGNRGCSYPSPSTSKKRARGSTKKALLSSDSDSSSSGDDDSGHGAQDLSAIDRHRDDSIDYQGDTNSNASMSTKSQKMRASSIPTSAPANAQPKKLSDLPGDIKYYLRYHKREMGSYYHAFKLDMGDFVKGTLHEMAINDASHALLYAIVAAAAYHHTLARDDEQIAPFLSYYNESIVRLHRSLQTKKPCLITLLTILQLASIEEFLGDWLNLIIHQKAAYHILIDLFTPETMIAEKTGHQVLDWYMRFDLYAGFIAGGGTTLSREWFVAAQVFCRETSERNPDDLNARFANFFATSRLFSLDVGILLAAQGRESSIDQEFLARAHELRVQCDAFEHAVNTAFTDPTCFVQSFPNAPAPSEADIVDYRDPHFLYGGKYFVMNIVLLDFWAIDLMLRYRMMLLLNQQPSPEMSELAFKQAKLIEAIVHCEEGGTGAILCCHASLGVASLCLPADEKHIMWQRRMYALMEQKGYIYPSAVRAQASARWGVDVMEWWLPNGEGRSRTIKAFRDFIIYRERKPEDAIGANVRDMSGIFGYLRLCEPASGQGLDLEPDFEIEER